MVPARFRFRPRFRGLAWSAALVGAGLLAAAPAFGASGASLAFSLLAGGAGLVLGTLYLLSPAWRLEVRVGDEGLEVRSGGRSRFRLGWDEFERVVASPETKTCFVDGGEPERSLLVPGPGAQAPYDIEDRHALFDAILARAPREVVENVALLCEAEPARKPGGAESRAGEPEGEDRENGEELGAEDAGEAQGKSDSESERERARR